ncbi:MAG: A24 family peptidase [Phycisphaeraceae bacterium]|nr:A24 family peptidase [Phycisphaeraceae bacterium]MCW5753621.1 A24 family peptidase [Phycisphaeraceae bacterium]
MTLAIQSHEWLYLLGGLTWVFFAFAFGACVGSLTNVLVYRLPLGLSVVTPPSRCPSCGTQLAWKDNIPVLGWLALGGRCRYCRTRISPEYPLVEAFVGLLFVVAFAICYFAENPVFAEWRVLGISWKTIQPDWAAPGFARTWPIFVVQLTLLSCLVAMTLVDAKTYTIPLVLTWVPAVAGVVGLTAYAAWFEFVGSRRISSTIWADGWSYAIATPGPHGWKWVGAAIGGVAGLGISLLLVRLKLLSRSFADYDQWAASRTPESTAPSTEAGTAQSSEGATEASEASEHSPPDAASASPRGMSAKWVVLAGVLVAAGAAGAIVAPRFGFIRFGGVLFGVLVGAIVGAIAVRALGLGPPPEDESGEPAADAPTEEWLDYPHARREVIREVLYLAPCLGLAVVGAAVAMQIGGPWSFHDFTGARVAATPVPLWLDALSGSLMGYLIGGGVVWAVRILGSLLFGKEAMGLGDVHMMAAVGACLGWIDPVLAFFLAAFVGVYREILSRIWSGAARRAMPFGPSLAAATVIVLFGKPWIEDGINRWMHRTPEQRIELP